MTKAELIFQRVKNLPEEKQSEVLDFVGYLDRKASMGADATDEEWSSFSLAAAMRGMESEDTPDYSWDDLKERFS